MTVGVPTMPTTMTRNVPWRVRVQIPYLGDFLRDLSRLPVDLFASGQRIEVISQLADNVLKGLIPLSRYTQRKLTSDLRDWCALHPMSRLHKNGKKS